MACEGYAKTAQSAEEAKAAGAEYAIIDSLPYEVPDADKYVLVIEPRHKPPQLKNIFVIVNKAGRGLFAKNAIPFDDSVHWAMSAGYPPIAVRNVKSWKRLRDVVKWVAESL
ncbi:hypothetical protein [Pyrobaculum aerophilum]|uniref:Uncharacterized protein n=1 Tax=Pyrobaculum aerophilum TaxID=13773 RepID=A0A371QWE7_9CREN|nr:hypothetical protein [Pyrobaculum aerophilum]RFA94523.1 hypothetical protein CGL52_14295 [Pyrobaculum aerophilum]